MTALSERSTPRLMIDLILETLRVGKGLPSALASELVSRPELALMPELVRVAVNAKSKPRHRAVRVYPWRRGLTCDGILGSDRGFSSDSVSDETRFVRLKTGVSERCANTPPGLEPAVLGSRVRPPANRSDP